ncbi:hypothetical protein [Sporosarcina sp. NPDC096371]|uniref:hypothetical protein n=1 Tax=Sporosarcina sp. NPDC096371 TaxID=3364530 RepID=UPI0038112AC6
MVIHKYKIVVTLGIEDVLTATIIVETDLPFLTASKNKTAAHELGHALGISDHYDPFYKSILMYGYSTETNTLQTHDKAD